MFPLQLQMSGESKALLFTYNNCSVCIYAVCPHVRPRRNVPEIDRRGRGTAHVCAGYGNVWLAVMQGARLSLGLCY